MTDADRLNYVSVLSFDDEWLGRLRNAAPFAEVRQYRNASLADVPSDVLRDTHLLHTSTELPDPRVTPSLRCVQLDTSGVDHVLGSPLWQSTIPIATIGGVSPLPLAEYVLFLLLGFAHRLPAMLDTRATRAWPSTSDRWTSFLPAALAGATVGIVGYGRIGREIGRMALDHGMHVIGVTRTGTDDTAGPTDGVEVVGSAALVDVVPRCDYLVVVCPLTEHTRGLIGAKVLGELKPGAVLINAARGGIVDEDALLAQLRNGQLGGAALDVFEHEPLSPDSPWWDEPGVFVTPHIAGLAPLYGDRVLEIVSTNLHRLAERRPLVNLVDRERGY